MTLGAEYQAAYLDFQQFENNMGQPGNLNTTSFTRSTQAHVFTEFERKIGDMAFLRADASLSKVAYLQSKAWSSIGDIPLGKTTLAPTPAGSITFQKNDQHYAPHKTLFIKLATGYSPPALWEMTDSTGELQTNLRPEYGLNAEIRGSTRFTPQRHVMEFTVYHHTIWNTIVPQALGSGRTVFENNGRTTQMGLEAYIHVQKAKLSRDNENHLLGMTASGAMQFYRFNDYSLDGVSFAGKSIPGVPLLTANLQADWLIKQATEVQLTQQFVGKSWLNNANTVAQNGYLLLNLKASHTFRIRQYNTKPVRTAVTIAPFAGVNNLLNTRYANFPNLNAVNGRFWNPAPGINGFGGIDCRF
jgi:iron complex outermembrane receptor protein